MQIGFIGLGMMGAGMASNLQKAGHQLVVHDLSRQAASRHLANGATWAESPRAVAEAVDVVFTSLPTPADVEKVGTGEDGLLSGFRKGSAWFDLSTNAVSVVRALHAQLAEQGVEFLDAPVSGGPRGANSGRLAIWVGGDKAVFDKYKAVLDAMGDAGALHRPDRRRIDRQAGAQRRRRRGEHRAGRGVHHGREGRRRAACRCGRRSARAPADARVCSTAWRDDFLTGSYDPPDFALRLLHKDVSLACQLARDVGVPMRLTNLAHRN